MQLPELSHAEIDEAAQAPTGALLRSGVAWNTLFQAFAVVVSFGSMLVLVRIIPPREYGRAGAVTSLLALFNAVTCRHFVSHALQLPAGVVPDWSQHLSAAVRIQFSLAVICNAIGFACWFMPAYRPIAPLVHIASVGLFVDSFAQVGSLMLERAMNFRRLRILSIVAIVLYAITILPLGIAGYGALAIVLSGTTGGLPMIFDLFLLRRWRPRPGWWQKLDWRAYKPALKFGSIMVGSASLTLSRSGLEFAVLPVRAGYTAIGLWSRAQALFTISIARLMAVLQQTVYPLLPRYAARRESYPRYATLFAQVMIWLLVPSTIYLGLEGKALSRMLYGNKWIGADPMIWPGALLGLGLWIFMISGTVNLAANRLRVCLRMDVLAACMSLPAFAVAWFRGGIVAYAWAFALGQLLVGLINFSNAARFVHNRWPARVLLPTTLSAAIGAGGMIAIQRLGLRAAAEVAVTAVVFPLLVLIAFRLFFMEDFREVLTRLPGGSHLRRAMWIAPQQVLSTAQPAGTE